MIPGPRSSCSPVPHFPRRHVHLEQRRMQPAELLTQADQFVLVAFLLPAQDFVQQGRRARRRLVTLDPRLPEAGALRAPA